MEDIAVREDGYPVSGGWLAELEPDEVYTGASNCVLRCPNGHRWGAWPDTAGTRCIAEVENSIYTNGLCGGILEIEEANEGA